MNTDANQQSEVEKYRKLLDKEIEEHTKTKIKLKARERELHTITKSNSYKIARVLALSKHGVRITLRYFYNLTPKRYRMIKGNQLRVKRGYRSKQFYQDFSIKPAAKLAIILHLYYPDLLSYFEDKLKYLSLYEYDLYITITEKDKSFREEIKQRLPKARVFIVPNCGRDVLPFVAVMKHIEDSGYEAVLKIHSKKSPHRLDGDLWRDEIVGSLLPKNSDQLERIITTLSNPSTGILGPKGQYVSFLVNFSATGHYSRKITERILSKQESINLINNSDEYGFFAGTMFWSRVDALMPIINTIKIEDFEPEFGQEDSTLAHALERLFTVIPELEKKDIYEMTAMDIVKIDYHTTNIPSWSEVALDN